MKPELRVVARRQHDAELLRAARDEFGDVIARGSGAEFMDVVDDQQDRPIEPGELGDQPLYEARTVEMR